MIAVTYLFSAFAVVILPFRKPDRWAASPASRLKLLGVPIVPVAGLVTIGLIGYCLYEWLSNANYGVNNNNSLIYMGAMYVLALVIFLAENLPQGPAAGPTRDALLRRYGSKSFRLHHRRRRLGGQRARRPAVGRPDHPGARARGGPARLHLGPVHPHAGGADLPDRLAFYDWKYESEPEPHLNGRRIYHARGKVLGGSSSSTG